MKVRYIGEGSPMTCTNGKIYEVLSIELDSYRIIDDTDEDYLYDIKNFEIVEEDPPAPILMK